MSSLYRVIKKSLLPYANSHHYKRIEIICDDGQKVTQLSSHVHFNHGNITPCLQKLYDCCDALPEKRIQSYFFKNCDYYKNDEYVLLKVRQIPGRFFPRIYRPILREGDSGTATFVFNSNLLFPADYKKTINYIPGYNSNLIKSLQQLSTLIERLKTIFNYVYPTKNNYKTYGHELRNLLILACTEVDAQFKGIMIANDLKPQNGKSYSMLDYVKLKKILKLDNYFIKFPYFPEIKPVSPFKRWAVRPGKKGLVWYNDYNAVKHNREEDFKKATLENCINSVSAVAILLICQYGNKIPYWDELIGSFFELHGSPVWSFDECYIPPIENSTWSEEKLQL
jgi:hypothetical protein